MGSNAGRWMRLDALCRSRNIARASAAEVIVVYGVQYERIGGEAMVNVQGFDEAWAEEHGEKTEKKS